MEESGVIQNNVAADLGQFSVERACYSYIAEHWHNLAICAYDSLCFQRKVDLWGKGRISKKTKDY
jgi:hypothetical protein